VTYLRASSSRFWASQLFAKWSCIGFKQKKTVQPLVRKFNSNTKSVKVVSIEFSTMFKAKKWLQKLNNAQNMKTISSHWIYNHLIKLFISNSYKQKKTVQPLVRKFNSNTKSVKVVSIEFSTMFKAIKWLQKLNNAQNMKTHI
jgi:hypothetical protein